MSWDEDDFEPPSVIPVVVGVTSKTTATKRFEEEDKEETKESWENLDVKENAPSTSTKKKLKEIVKAKEAPKPASTSSDTPLDAETEKLRQQQIIEEAELQNTQAMFTGLDLNKDLVIDLKNPKDEKDFEVLAELIATKVAIFEKSIHYRHFLKTFIKKASTSLKNEDLKELSTAITVLANEKLQAEKGSKKKKKTTSKKSINVKEDNDYDNIDDEYGDFM